MFEPRATRPLLLALMGLLLASCALRSRQTLEAPAPAPEEPVAPLLEPAERADQPYLIRFGDRLTLATAGHDDSRLDVLVRPDGCVSLPWAGEIEVVGRTIPHLQREAEAAFAHRWREPRVFVNVEEMAPMRCYVFGEVNRPGIVESETPLNVIQVLAMAGGQTDAAELRNLIVIDDLGNGEKRVRTIDITSSEPADLLRISLEQIDSFDIVIVPRRLISEIGQFVRDFIVAFLPPIDTYLRGRYYWTLIDEGN